MEKLFSYGTLQMTHVQIETFGRELQHEPDGLPGYELKDCLITDSGVVDTSGIATHPIACFTGHGDDVVSGMVFDITLDELHQADNYEVSDYKRVSCVLQSGIRAWVYVQNSES